jgi:putative ABC transport system permease protein
MSLWRQLARGLAVLTHRAAADRDIADEVEHYLEESKAAHRARGLSPDAASMAAQRELGSVVSVREEVRQYGWENLLEVLWADLRYAARRLRRNSGFATVCVLTLALGIGASTAIFSAVDPILFAPLPYPNAAAVVALSDLAAGGAHGEVTYGTYREVEERSRSFGALAVADRWRPALVGTAEPERLDGDRVSSGYFRVLGVGPALGRGFEASDERRGAPRVTILSDALWRRRFGGRRSTLGEEITLDGDAHTVIGIMPRGFDNVISPSTELWAPLRYRARAPFEGPEWGHHLRMVGRLAAGVSREQARRDLDGIAAAPAPDFPRPRWASLSEGFLVERLQDAVTRPIKPALLAIFGAVLLLLLIACANVTNLLLARGTQRRGEFAMRAALGASRMRLLRQLLTESLLLAAVGGALGLGVAALGVRALLAVAPAGLPRAGAIGLDSAAFAFTLAVTAIVGVSVGLAPALQGSRDGLRAELQSGPRGAGVMPHLLRRCLVASEVALALVLLVGAGLMLRSLRRLFAVAPGFDASHLLTMQVEAAGHRYDSDEAKRQFFEQALDAVRRLPGVTAAAFTSQLPLSGDLDGYGVDFQSVPRDDPTDYASALRYTVTPGWFRTMKIALRRGRLLDSRDRPGAPEAVVISESLAKRMFPGRDPIGQRLRIGPEVGQIGRPWDPVVGVVGDVTQTSLALAQPDAFYVAMGQWSWVDGVQSLAVRAAGGPASLAPAVERAIWSADRNQPILRVATMDELVARSEADRRFVLEVFQVFALAALALSAIGVFGILSGSVNERLREIGVRSALGASRSDILALVVRQGAALTGLGVAVGLAGAAGASRAIAAMLFGVSRFDPVTYLGVALLLAAVSLASCALPAWRAARVDPANTLRSQ